MLDQIPLEILVNVLSSLECVDLQAVRLVNKTLSSKVGSVLFRTLYISCLTLDRLQNITVHPTLRLAVEELQYQEFRFDLIVDDPRSWDAIDRPVWRDTRTHYLIDTIAEFISTLNPAIQHSEDSETSDPREGDTMMADAEPMLNVDGIQAMIIAVKELYAEKARLQSPQRLYEVFREALPRLPNLRRVICVEAEAEGECTALDPPRIERTGAFQRLRNTIRLSDYALRSSIQPDARDWPSHGFMGVWRALSDRDSNPGIRHLEIRRDGDLFLKRGVYLYPPEPKDDVLVDGFRNLTFLSLCLEVDFKAPPSAAVPHASILAGALARATQLRRLEICLTSRGVLLTRVNDSLTGYSHWGIPFGGRDDNTNVSRINILPFVTFPELHTVVFEQADFTSDQIYDWLSMQPKLRHLTLKSPYLRGQWHDLVQKWSDNPEFLLDSFELSSPWDHDNRDLEETVRGPEQVRVPSHVRSGGVLDFINHGGLNPFEGRTWRPFSAAEERRGNAAEEEEDNRSDSHDHDHGYYSDLSEWSPEDHPTPVEDPDGPEFDEDYDFDAEEDCSDFEMEDVGPSAERAFVGVY